MSGPPGARKSISEHAFELLLAGGAAAVAAGVALVAGRDFLIPKAVELKESSPPPAATDAKKTPGSPTKGATRAHGVRVASKEFTMEHAHRSESEYLREDWHYGEEESWVDYEPILPKALGSFAVFKKDGVYAILTFLEIPDLQNLKLVSSGFRQISRRLLADRRYLRVAAIAGFDKKRAMCWQTVVNSSRSLNKYRHKYDELLAESLSGKPIPSEVQIGKDICRTFPDLDYFKNPANVEKLKELLLIYSLDEKEIGYTQGMNYIAAFIMMNMNSNLQTSFWMMDCLLREYDLRWLFLPGLPHLSMFLWEFDHVLFMFLPEVYDYFQKQKIPHSLYAVEWFVTVFTYAFPPEAVARIWDLFLVDGWKVVFQVGLAVLELCKTDLFSLEFEGAVHYLKNFPNSELFEPNLLMKTALSFKVSDFLLEEMEELYVRDVVEKKTVSDF